MQSLQKGLLLLERVPGEALERWERPERFLGTQDRLQRFQHIYTHVYIYIYIYIYKLKAYFIIVCSTVAKKKLVIEGMNEPSTGQDTSEIELIETFGAPATNVFSALFAEVEIKVIQ